MQNAVTTTGPASNETEGAQNTRVVAEVRTKDTIPEEISAIGSIEDAKGADHHHEGTTVHSTYNVDDSAYQHTLTDTTSLKLSLVTSTSSIRESKHEETSADITSHKTNATDTTDNIVEQKNGEHVVDPTTGIRIQCRCSLGDFEGKKQREAIRAGIMAGEWLAKSSVEE